ncbi:phage protein Gp37, partial [Desulfovibrio sp. 1188_IL3213]
MLPIMEIENGIIEQIAAAKLPYLRLVSSYGGELMGDWQGVIRALPAVWVTFKDSTAPEPLNTASTRFRTRLAFTTIVADRSVRSEAATRKGGPGNVGTYQM